MTDAIAHELTGLSREWMEAVQQHDRDRLEELLAEEFTVAGLLGEVGRSEWIENAATANELDEFVYEEIEIEVYGTTAVLSSRYREVARLGEQDLGGDFLVTDVWVRRDGRWQVVRRHATRTG